MKTLIQEVVIQVNSINNKCTVFTKYKFKGQEYTGFNVFDNLEDAEENAEEQVRAWDNKFMSITEGYFIKELKENRLKKETYIQIK